MSKSAGADLKVYFKPGQTFTGPAAGDRPTAASVSALADTDSLIANVMSYDDNTTSNTVDITDADSTITETLVTHYTVALTINMNRNDDADSNQDNFFVHDGANSTGVGGGVEGAVILRPNGVGSGKVQYSGLAVVTDIAHSTGFDAVQTRTVSLMVNDEWAETTQA